MTHKVCYWDDKEKRQLERDSKPEEDAQMAIDISQESSQEDDPAIDKAKKYAESLFLSLAKEAGISKAKIDAAITKAEAE